jgi:hypothetical protein
MAAWAVGILGEWEKLPSGGHEFLDIASYNQHAFANRDLTEQVGTAFFPTISLLNHRCVPNVQYRTTRKDGMLFGQLVALTDIVAGEELTKDYANNGHAIETRLDLKENREVRSLHISVRYQLIMKLAAEHSFRCDCEDCVRCARCGRDADTHCFRCGIAWCSTACKTRDEFHADVCSEMLHLKANFPRVQNGTHQ